MKQTRRRFLQKAGQVTLGLGIASQLGWQSSCNNLFMSSEPSQTAWRDLASNLQGRLLRPGDSGYANTGLPTNLIYSDVRPQGIAQCAGPADVQASVRWAREQGLSAVARSGGHSYAGYSTTTGLLVDLSPMNAVSVDPSTGVVDAGAGTLLGAMAKAVMPFDVVVPAGHCETVGVGGLVLGGGFGFNGRKFGLTSDNLVQTQIVTADGELRICDAHDHPDLFWACRGGGGGNFGINVGFQIQAHPVTTAAVFDLTWEPDDAVALWSALQHIGQIAPDDFSLRLASNMSESGPLPGATNENVTAMGQFFGSADELRDLLAPAFSVATPTSSTIKEVSFADASAFLEEHDHPDAFLTKAAYLPSPIPEVGLETMLAWIRRWPAESRAAAFKIYSWGGAYNRVPPEATAFAHRSEAFIVGGDASWHPGDPQPVVDASKDWIQGLFADMQPYFTGSNYQNFIDPTLPDWRTAYYGVNFQRLVEVKRAYDPDNFFNFAQSIPTRL